MNQVQMAAQLYDARDVMKTLLGERYVREIAPFQEYVRQFAKKNTDGKILEAAIAMATQIGQDKSVPAARRGTVVMKVLTAAVEILEPSQVSA